MSGCTSLIFKPSKVHDPIPEEWNPYVKEYYFPSLDNTKLHGWFLPSRQDPLNPKQTILFLHGTTNNISRFLGEVNWLTDAGYEIYLIDYRGYGKSDGSPYSEGILMDIHAAINDVSNKIDSDEKFIILGHSLGASMGIYVLSQSDKKNQVDSFIAVSAFADYRTAARDFLSHYWFAWLFQWPLSLTISNDYRPIDYVAKLSPVSTLFLHGKADKIVEPHQSLELYEAAQQPKAISIIKSNHRDIFSYPENRQLLLEYLDKRNQINSNAKNN